MTTIASSVRPRSRARGRFPFIGRATSTRRNAEAGFAEFAEVWLASKPNLRPATANGYRVGLRHANSRIGHLSLAEVNVDDIARLVAELHKEGFAGNTILAVLKPVRQVFARALRLGLVPANPVDQLERYERPTFERAEMRILDRHEIGSLLANAAPSYRLPLATAIFTGLRCGELTGLQFDHLALDLRIIRVRQQADRAGNVKALKTQHARRDVLLTPALADMLRRHRLGSPERRTNGYVFSRRPDRPMHPETLRHYGLHRAAVAAGLERPGRARLRLHDLRHTYASLLIAQGMSVAFVSRQMGHSSISTTLDIYTHLFDQAEHGVALVERLEREFGDLLRAQL
jgi:integrase